MRRDGPLRPKKGAAAFRQAAFSPNLRSAAPDADAKPALYLRKKAASRKLHYRLQTTVSTLGLNADVNATLQDLTQRLHSALQFAGVFPKIALRFRAAVRLPGREEARNEVLMACRRTAAGK